MKIGSKRGRDEEQTMTKQTPNMKPLTHNELQQRNRNETGSRLTTGGWALSQFYSRENYTSKSQKYTLSSISNLKQYCDSYIQDKIFRRKRLSTGANFVHVYLEIWDMGILKFNKFPI